MPSSFSPEAFAQSVASTSTSQPLSTNNNREHAPSPSPMPTRRIKSRSSPSVDPVTLSPQSSPLGTISEVDEDQKSDSGESQFADEEKEEEEEDEEDEEEMEVDQSAGVGEQVITQAIHNFFTLENLTGHQEEQDQVEAGTGRFTPLSSFPSEIVGGVGGGGDDEPSSPESSSEAGGDEDTDDEYNDNNYISPDVLEVLKSGNTAHCSDMGEVRIRSNRRKTIPLKKIKVGDIVKVEGGNVEDDDWLGKVEIIRSIAPSLSPHETPISQIFVTVSWLYSKKDLDDMTSGTDELPAYPDAWRWNKCKGFMGKYGSERISTKHADWQTLGSIKRMNRAYTIIFDYDDRYPATCPQSTPYECTPHPLTLATPSLKAESFRPYFFFGDELNTPKDRMNRDNVKSAKLDDDKFAGSRFIRTLKGEFELVKEEVEEASRPQSKRSTNSYKGYGWQPQTKREIWEKEMQFHKHSDPPQPYDPQVPQIYFQEEESNGAQKWYNQVDLVRMCSYTNKSKDAPAPSNIFNDDSMDDSLAGLLERIGFIAHSPIVRGGYYGLIGNAYMVILARRLKLTFKKSGEDEEMVEKSWELIEAYKRWRVGVSERQTEREKREEMKRIFHSPMKLD